MIAKQLSWTNGTYSSVQNKNGKTSIFNISHNMLRVIESSSYIGTNGFGKNDSEPVYFWKYYSDVVTLLIK